MQSEGQCTNCISGLSKTIHHVLYTTLVEDPRQLEDGNDPFGDPVRGSVHLLVDPIDMLRRERREVQVQPTCSKHRRVVAVMK